LSYYSQGAFTQEIVYNLPIHLRIFYSRKLIETKTKEAEEINNAKNGKSHSPKAIAKGPAI
jgi:hypothetical protein